VCDSIHRSCVTGICLGYRPGSLRRIFTSSYSLPPSLVAIRSFSCSTDSPGRPSLPLRNTVPPTPVRLTRRALEGGPAEPSNAFPVTTQGYAVTSGRRERTFPSLSALCGHPRPYSATPSTVTTSLTLLECTGTGCRHDRHCAAYGPPR
jgi:hypothetical protein